MKYFNSHVPMCYFTMISCFTVTYRSVAPSCSLLPFVTDNSAWCEMEFHARAFSWEEKGTCEVQIIAACYIRTHPIFQVMG